MNKSCAVDPGGDRVDWVADELYETWQEIVDLLASILELPAALIMRATAEEIEVYVTSHSEGNPYKRGDHEHLWGSGLYCERVLRTQKRLLIPDATKDSEWDSNPDIKLKMISYLGYPLSFPDGAYFGTLCVLDTKENAYSQGAVKLIERFRDLVQGNLAMIQINHELGLRNSSMQEMLDSVRTLKGMHPICSHCKMIQNENGEWEPVAEYITRRSEAAFSHTVCSTCLPIHYPDSAKRMGMG